MAEDISIPRSRRSDIDLGLGSTLVAHGMSDGLPILTFSTVKHPGAPGQPGTAQEVKRAKRTVVLRFHSMPAVLAHLDMVRSMMEHFEAALASTRDGGEAGEGRDGTG